MIKNVFFYLVGVLLVGLVLTPIVFVALKPLTWGVAVAVALIPFYGLLRSKKKEYNGLKTATAPVMKKFKRSMKVNLYNFTSFLIAGVIISVLFDELVHTLARMIMISLSTLFVVYVTWEAARFGLKKFKGIEIPSFKEAMGLAF